MIASVIISNVVFCDSDILKKAQIFAIHLPKLLCVLNLGTLRIVQKFINTIHGIQRFEHSSFACYCLTIVHTNGISAIVANMQNCLNGIN